MMSKLEIIVTILGLLFVAIILIEIEYKYLWKNKRTRRQNK